MYLIGVLIVEDGARRTIVVVKAIVTYCSLGCYGYMTVEYRDVRETVAVSLMCYTSFGGLVVKLCGFTVSKTPAKLYPISF